MICKCGRPLAVSPEGRLVHVNTKTPDIPGGEVWQLCEVCGWEGSGEISLNACPICGTMAAGRMFGFVDKCVVEQQGENNEGNKQSSEATDELETQPGQVNCEIYLK